MLSVSGLWDLLSQRKRQGEVQAHPGFSKDVLVLTCAGQDAERASQHGQVLLGSSGRAYVLVLPLHGSCFLGSSLIAPVVYKKEHCSHRYEGRLERFLYSLLTGLKMSLKQILPFLQQLLVYSSH